MSASFPVSLDNSAPASVGLKVNGGATAVASALVAALASTSDTVLTGYQVKYWGDLDLTFAKANGIVGPAAVTTLEADALWLPFDGVTAQQLKLSTPDGAKTVYSRLRDNLGNQAAAVSVALTLTTVSSLVVSTTPPSATAVSAVSGSDTFTFQFQATGVFNAYAVMAVSSATDAYGTGVQVPSSGGSTNVQGSSGNYPAATPITVTIKGADLLAAFGAGKTGTLKVFVQDPSGDWSA